MAKTEQFIADCQQELKVESPDCAVDHSLRMKKLNENTLTLKTLQKSQLKLKQLNLVLKKINDNNFGICLKCKSPIPIQRILIRPESLLCVNCSE